MIARPTLKRWYAIWTNARQEVFAEGQLRLEGFETLLPTIRSLETLIQEPLFPGYLFINFDIDLDPWQKIHSTPGVKSLLSSSTYSPTPIPDPIIAELREGLPAYLGEAEEYIFRCGDKVQVIRGHLKGRTGICSWAKKQRVKLLMDILGGSVTLPLVDIMLVD